MARAQKNSRPPRLVVNALLIEACGLINEALEVYLDEVDGHEDPRSARTHNPKLRDELMRARAALWRAMAHPKQLDTEFKAALGRLSRRGEPGPQVTDQLYDALRAHVLELVWADGLNEITRGEGLIEEPLDQHGRTPGTAQAVRRARG